MTKSQKILVGAAVASAVIAGAFTLARRPAVRPPSATPDVPTALSADPIDVSRLTWDAKTTIPGTGVTFSYPRGGFYENGITLTKGDRSQLQVFSSVANYAVTKLWVGSKFTQEVGMYLSIYELGNEKTLEDAMTTVGSQMPDVSLGHYQDVNGTRFFLVPTSDPRAVVSYNAYALIKGRLLAVTFLGGFKTPEPGGVPDIVTLFLSHLDFTCASDCSVNSAPVVEEHMPTEGQ